jgi:hypothetical protein
MARPITNRNNWWREEDEKSLIEMLTGCAVLTLQQCGGCENHQVEVGDLISEGWLKVLRYGNFDKASRKTTAWRLVREMKVAFWRMKRWGTWPDTPFQMFPSRKEGRFVVREAGECLLPEDWIMG